MSDNGKKERGVYVNLPDDIKRKVDTMASILPPKPNGRKWFKGDIIEVAIRKYVKVFFDFVGEGSIGEMIEKAKEVDPDGIEIDLLDENARPDGSL